MSAVRTRRDPARGFGVSHLTAKRTALAVATITTAILGIHLGGPALAVLAVLPLLAVRARRPSPSPALVPVRSGRPLGAVTGRARDN